MATLNVNGVELAYDESGNGPPVLLVHEGIADRRMWDDVMPAFAKRFRTIRCDLRGYGETSPSRRSIRLRADVAELMRALDATPAHLVGVSMGGQVALDPSLQSAARFIAG